MTEPIQPQYLLLTLEQYNKIAEYFSTVGNSIVRNTDLISELPTHQDLNNLIVQTLRPCLTEMRKAATDKMDSIEYSTKDKLSRQTDSLKEQLHTEICRMMNELKAKDLTPWKLKLGGGWGNITVDALYLAADIAMIGEPDNNDKQKLKVVRERKRGQKKKQIQDSHDDGGMRMNM